MRRMLGAGLVVAMVAVLATPAEAASLKVCWDGGSVTADAATLQVLADDVVIYPDMLAGAVTDPLLSTKKCNTKPFPTSLVRGVNTAVTIKAVNALGEVGPASNAVTFRAPAVPPIVTGVTVQGVTGP